MRKLCLAEHQHWDNGRKITVALRETGQAERDTVLRAVYRMNENEFSRYFFRRAFVGDFGTTPKQLTTATGIRRFVFNVPGAIGFIRASELDESVKLVLVDGHQPSETGYPLALRVKEPEP